MAITLSDTFLKAMGKANAEPIVHVAMQTYDGSLSLYFHNGHGTVDSTINGDPTLKSINAVSAEIDAVTRDSQISSIQFEIIDDGLLRSYIPGYEFFNAHVYVQLGSPDITLSDFLPLFFGRVTRTWGTEGSVFFEATDYVDFTMNPPDSMRTYINKHPLEVLEQALQDAGIPLARLDTSTFAPGYFDGFSHYCFTSYTGAVWGDAEVKTWHPKNMGSYDAVYIEGRHSTSAPGTGGFESGEGLGMYMNMVVVRPKLFLKEYCELTRSALRQDVVSEKLKMVRTTASTAVSKHFTVDEYSDFEVVPNPVIFNQVILGFGYGPSEFDLTVKDTDSISNYGTFDYKTRVNYLTAGSSVYQDPPAYEDYTGFLEGDSAAFDELNLRDIGISGFCGTRNLHAGTQGADDKVDTDKLFFGLYLNGIYKASSNFVDGEPDADYFQYTFNNVGTSDTIYAGLRTLNLKGMTHHHGTAATADTDGHFFHDITIAFNFATEVLSRFSNGAPKIKFFTTLDNAGLELGDLISVDNDWFLSSELSLDGLDSNTKFEIVQKEISPVGDTIGVEYSAVYMTTASPPSTSISTVLVNDIWGSPVRQQFFTAKDKQTTSSPAVIDGFSVTATSGLGCQVGAGKISASSPTAIRLSEDVALTVPANKDTYVGIDSRTGSIYTTPVTTGAEEPKLAPFELRIGKVVAASSVSSVADLRTYGAISATQFDRELMSPGFGGMWNGDFEMWPSSGGMPIAWEETGSGKVGTDSFRETSVVKRGKYSVRMANTSVNVVWYTDYFAIDKNTPYRVSMWCRQKTGNVTMRSDIYWYTSAKAAASASSASITNAACAAHNTWESRSTVVTPGSDVAYARLKITRPTNPGYDCYWDDISIFPEKPSFLVKRTSSNNTPASDGDNYIFNTEVHDYGGNYDTGTGAFTVPVSGTYEFSATLSLEGADPNRDAYVTMTASTGGVLASGYLGNLLNGADEWNDNGVFTLSVVAASLVEGETVSIKAYNAAGGGDLPALVYDYSWFSGSLK